MKQLCNNKNQQNNGELDAMKHINKYRDLLELTKVILTNTLNNFLKQLDKVHMTFR